MLMMWKIQQAKQDDAKFIRKINPAWKIYKRFRGKARFPKQGSCEDALKRKINVFSYKDH